MTYRSDTLKEAIVNKLKEYDAYIDNELPDYILVMLANKKTVSQISQDLELFLGDNTRRFSNWLKGVLEKPELLSPSTSHGRKRSFEAAESKEADKDVKEPSPPPPPPKRKIIVRSSTQEGDKETNRSSTYKRLEIVHETTTHETTHHSSKQSEVSVSGGKEEEEEEEEDEPVAPTLSSVIKRPTAESKPQPSGRILLRAISAIQSNSRSNRNKPDRKSTKQQSEVTSGSDSRTDDVPNKEVEELPSGDLRRRLGKKNTPSQSDSKNEETPTPTDVKTEPERVVVRPKFVVTMNQVDDKYKSDADKEVMSNEASDDVSPTVIPERCRFWPNCKNGDICPYYHPSVPCKLFPKCKFGDKCRFIHPICKFNAQCMKPGCPYLHTAPRSKQTLGSGVFPVPTGVMAAPPLDVVSHYKWNPPGPGGHHKTAHKTNQYVWTSSKTHISERKFVTSDKPAQMPVSANI